MAKITKAEIAATINKLRQSGRAMPQAERMRGAANVQETAMAIYRETVELWWNCFGGQGISVERWASAERIALTMGGAVGVPTNVISTNLMGEALRRAESQYLEEQRVRYEAEKKSEGVIDEEMHKITQIMWTWTRMMMQARLPCIHYKPRNEQEITKYCLERKMTREQADKWRPLVTIAMATEKVCSECSRRECPFGGLVPTIVHDGTKAVFKYEQCKRGKQK